MDPKVLGLKMTNLSTTPVSPLLTGFSKPVFFPWRSVGTSTPAYVSGCTVAFLQAVAAKIIPCYSPGKGSVPGPPRCTAS